MRSGRDKSRWPRITTVRALDLLLAVELVRDTSARSRDRRDGVLDDVRSALYDHVRADLQVAAKTRRKRQ
jgi:hypothetical protein